MKLLQLTAGALLVALPALYPLGANAEDEALRSAIAAKHRTPAYAARDVYRHPQETLEFFGLKPDMTVVEVWPGGGWWTEILAPYLRARGQYYVAGFVVDVPDAPGYRKRIETELGSKLAAAPQIYDRVHRSAAGLPDRWQLAPPGSADRVLTFRNIHNWIADGFEREMFAAMYRALKPGGILGVEEHRGRPGMTLDQIRKTGYVPQDYVVALAEQAGFKLVATSEINANPKDTTLHPEGVWTLPPTLALKDQDKSVYLAIGESDRMTLKFVKPMLIAPLAAGS
ncbi:MAG TPA: methyltransferase [Solimonas sp.]|nr:methyltransferase [Solimonas sp.]